MAASPSTNDNPRPLSTVELLNNDEEDVDTNGVNTRNQPKFKHETTLPDDGGGCFANAAFELSSPLTPTDIPFPRPLEVTRHRLSTFTPARPSMNLDEITEEHYLDYENANSESRQTAESSSDTNDNDTATTTAIIHENRVEDNRTNIRDRPSWLVDGRTRSNDDENLWRRRRKTDHEGNYSYHHDYQEALSSLLWEPYECRQPTPSTSGNLDDADVSLWLYPPLRNTNNNFPYGRDCHSSSTSTSSMSSTSSMVWPVESTCSRGGGIVGNNDPVEGVYDLHERRLVAPPRGALVVTSGNQRPFLCYEQRQCESNSVGVSIAKNMLVNVETSTTVSDTGGGVVSNNHNVVGQSLVSVNNNCYRAVPVVVSSVPTISCRNSVTSDNVSNVHIVQTSAPAVLSSGAARTFTSTEAQTDEVNSGNVEVANSLNNVVSNNNREQRRRERRERRHQRRVNTSHNHINHEQMWTTQLVEPLPTQGVGERLPDILNSHLPPPYSTLPLGLPPGHMPVVHPHPHPHPPLHHPHLLHPQPPPPGVQVQVQAAVLPGVGGSPPPPPPPQAGIRFPFQIAPTSRRRSRRTPRGPHYTPEEEPKSCCGVIVTQTVSIRWFIVMIAFVGICCAVVGTVLGAMKASGREHLTVSLLMIGVGIVLITVSGVAWRLTAHDAPSCRVMLGLSRGDEGVAEPNRRFVPRLPPSYGRPHHPYAAMMYPEFQYRPPPPSYQASMQEYRLRLLLLDRHAVPGQTGQSGNALSPPPTYRSHPGTLRTALGVRTDPNQDFSRPPSYRSRTSSTRPTLDPNGNLSNTPIHSRDPSLSLSEPCGGSTVNVISVHGNDMNEPEALDSIKMVPDQDLPLRMMIDKGSHSGSTVDLGKDGNLVTIVSTGNDPVIVTVSGSTMTNTTTCSSTSQCDTEMEILAHL